MVRTRVKKLVLKGMILSVASLSLLGICSYEKYNKQVSVYNAYLGSSAVNNIYPGQLIMFGSVGEDVKRIQTKLNQLGFNSGLEDGIFGDNTKAAVIKFQTSKSLEVDGIVGQETWNALFDIKNNGLSSYPGYYIRESSTGEKVAKIQQKLNELGFNAGYVDGIFGNNTKSAVIRFQTSKSLEVDGIVGQETWNALFQSSEIILPSNPDKDNSIEGGNVSEEAPTPSIPEVEKPERPNIEKPEIIKPNKIDGSKIVDYAYKFLGTPYEYGATGPNAFDNSGFTFYVYKQVAGIDISRTTYTQVNQGRQVSRDELEPGDLVFLHTGHVGIYVGNGKMIHVPQAGDVVKISNIWSFYTARRII